MYDDKKRCQELDSHVLEAGIGKLSQNVQEISAL